MQKAESGKITKAFFLIALSMSSLPATQASRLSQTVASRASTSSESQSTGPSATSKKRIGAVVSALQDLLASIESEEKEEAKTYKCYMQWCEDTVASKNTEIEEAEIALENNRVAVEQHTSKISTTEYGFKKNKEEQEEQTDALAEATEIRNTENKKFTEEDNSMKTNIKSLEAAIKILSKANALTQFMKRGGGQGRDPGQSAQILGMFKGLLENLQKNQAEQTAEEAKKQGLYDKLAAGKNKQLLALRDDSEKKLILIGEVKQDLAAAKNDIDDLTDSLKEDKTFLSKTELSCANKKKAWQIRSEDRAAEKAAIREAISFLVVSFKDGSLLQTSKKARGEQGYSLLQARVSQHSRASTSDVAMSMLDDTDEELSSMGTDEDASSKAARFEAVKKTLTELISILQSEQKEEKAKKEMCEADLKKKEGEKVETSDSVDMTQANVESKTNEANTLASEVKEIRRLMADSKKADELASKLRQDARKTYKTGAKDRAMTIKVLHSAMGVLQKFYNSFIQKDDAGLQKKGEKVSEKQPKDLQGNIIIAMLEKIIGDVEKEQKDALMAENEADAEYQTAVKESADAYEVRMEEITQKVMRKSRLKVQLGDQKETLDEQQDKLSAVKQQIVTLHKDCDELLKNYDKRTKDRTFEIAQIRDVFDILSGSAVAARTGLAQFTDNYFDDDGEDNKLQDMVRTTKDIAGKARKLRRSHH